MKDFKQLTVWQKGHELTLKVYAITAKFPNEELFGLTSQIRRAAASIPTNIAEGCGRGTDADFGRFLQIAMGSASETEYELMLASDLRYITEQENKEINDLIAEVKRMLAALIAKTKG